MHVGYDVTDNCPGTTCSLGVTISERTGGTDFRVIDSHTVSLRAIREGDGPGRVYTIAITCTDSGGAVSKQTTSVLVPHNQ